MANPKQLEILYQYQGVKKWNQWRREISETNEISEGRADLVVIDLSGAEFPGADLRLLDLTGANLTGADLRAASLDGADLREADLSGARFHDANLTGANLSEADLSGAELNKTDLSRAIFSGAIIGWTKFVEVNLSSVENLNTVKHRGPSVISIDTLYRSGGKIPKEFLLGCGVPEQFITFIPSLTRAVELFQYNSCFISYSKKDEDFAKRLHSRLRDAQVRVWFAPEDMKGGDKIFDQIERAIQIHDRLLIVLSEASLQSEWVMTEIRKARKAEIKEQRRKLFPIRLVDFETLQDWECFNADTGKDLAVEVREYFIPDFSNWKDHDSFEKGFERLLRDLREAEDVKEKVQT
jgi:uncharacterized protein YjbI with pentapeptide repeats